MTAPVITGLGVLSPNGIGHEEYWAATLAGSTGIAPLTRPGRDYPVRFGGEVAADDLLGKVPGRLRVQTDRWTHLAFAAAELALADAGVDPAALPEYEMAVSTAASSGGNEFGQREDQNLWAKGPMFVGSYQSIAWFYAACTGQLSIRHGMRGPCSVVVTEQAGGLDTVAHARRAIDDGARLAVLGGTEASLSPYALVCQLPGGRVNTTREAALAYLPFDRRAAGHVPGEGGAILIAEKAENARGRGYGQLAGYAATFDPKPGSGRPPGLLRCIQAAIADAGVTSAEVDVVFADAAAVPELDAEEAAALVAAFGPHGVPVTAPKTMVGRLYAGGSALDLATALLAIRHSAIPPTVGVDRPDPAHRLDLVRDRPRHQPVRTALVLARGAGGFNSAVVLTAPRP
ncbi:beta-ketoacyl synthase N-terminal-like domain-containing protein [Amycolatopsis vastitatis]|uniref:Ketosynthase chain-length factor n=1 Tax=Amycolatopsis vastitatis TaxID=1905142 RepID=A0A229TGC2_9PSEU|nr:beta-ketoacyl synthase N-terminal-like domain-containing protein [Amycolatopsis vastitatis]OXM69789.1 ketosynthase chain-length factor [Amycolatopsis vastitatis]